MSRDDREREAEERRRGRIKAVVWSAVVVVLIIAFIILAKLVASGSPAAGTSSTGASPAPASLVKTVTTLPASVFAAVGQGSVSSSVLPKPIQAPALNLNGKPRVVYIGAEYCPYCGAERWGMVIALSRFGTFSNLQVSHSSTTDIYPNTQTFSFHGATYSSPYLTFSGVETQSNQAQGTSYTQLDTLAADEQSLLNTYDATPYVPSSSAGSIPFIDFGGKYIISGASYNPQVLQGQSYDQIAAALSQSSSAISQGAVGTANVMTAAICKMTGDQPASVCKTSVMQNLETKLSSQ